MSGGGKTSTSTSSVQIPPEVMARYNAVNKYASDVAQTPYQPYQGQFVAPMTSTQNAALANVNQAAGQAQPYFTGATESLLQGQQAATPYYGAAMDVYGGAYGLGAQLGQESYGALQGAQAAAQPYNQAATGLAAAGTQAVNPTYLGQAAINQYMSPYLNNVVGATMQAMNQQNQEQQSQLTSDAIKSGAFGGDRSGVAAANLAYKQNLANQQTLANLYNTGYGQALGTAQQQQGVGLGAQQANRAALQAGAGQMMGIGQQQFGQGAATAGQLAGLGQQQFGQGLAAGQQIAGLGQGVYGMGEKTAQNLAALGTGAQGAALQGASAQLAAGTQEQQTQQAQNTALYNQFLQQQGYPFQVAQFLANIALGTGSQSGSTTTTTQPASFFSDKRLKENVHQVGETFDGQPIYRYNYKGQRGTQIGLIAQDVERKHPEAVGVAGGYKTVDYDRATEDAAHRGHFAYGGASMGGGVVPERAGEGFAEGGMPDYFAHILANARKGQIGAGLGGQTQGLNIPQGNMSPGRLAVASPPPDQHPRDQEVINFAKQVEAAKGLAGAAQSALVGSAATDKTAASKGILGAGGDWDTGKGYLASVRNIFGAAHGGAIRGYATDGRVNDDDVNPYNDPDKETFSLNIPNQKPIINPPKPEQAGSGQSGGPGNDLTKVAGLVGAGKTLFEGAAGLASLFGLSDKRLKENIHQIGKTFDGQPVYRYNYKGHPEPQIGLIAQEVEHKHPEAVGLAGGYKTVDYGRATEDAAHRGHFAYGGSPMGGLIPRHGFQVGGAPFPPIDDTENTNIDRQRALQIANQNYLYNVISNEQGLYNPDLQHNEVRASSQQDSPRSPQSGGLAASSQNVTPNPENIERGQLSLPTIDQPPIDANKPIISDSYSNYNSNLVDPTSVYYNLDTFNPRTGLGAAARTEASPAAQAARTEAAPGLRSGAEPYVPARVDSLPSTATAPAPAAAPRPSSPAPAPATLGSSPAQTAAPSVVASAPVGQGAQAGLGAVPTPSPAPEKPDEGSKGSWFSRNQDWLVPLLTGVGTMAASPSRYLGSAFAQGLAGAAGAYGNVQNQMIQREKIATETALMPQTMQIRMAEATNKTMEFIRGNYKPQTDENNNIVGYTSLLDGRTYTPQQMNSIYQNALSMFGADKGAATILGGAPTAPQAPAATPSEAGAPLTVRTNNPGAIKDGQFAKNMPGYVSSQNGFAVFKTAEDGRNAQISLLQNYANNGLVTPQQIVSRWASEYKPGHPKYEEDQRSVANYISNVSAQLGIKPTDQIDFKNPQVVGKLADAMASFESGAAAGRRTSGTPQAQPQTTATPASSQSYLAPQIAALESEYNNLTSKLGSSPTPEATRQIEANRENVFSQLTQARNLQADAMKVQYNNWLNLWTSSSGEHENALNLKQTANIMLNEFTKPSLRTGPIAPQLAKIAGIAQQAGVPESLYKIFTDPTAFATIGKLNNMMTSEIAKLDPTGSRQLLAQWQTATRATPNTEMPKAAAEFLLKNIIIPKADHAIGRFNELEKIPQGDYVGATKLLSEYDKKTPWFNPESSMSNRDLAIRELERRRRAASGAP